MFMMSANVHETRERGMYSKNLRLFTDNILVLMTHRKNNVQQYKKVVKFCIERNEHYAPLKLKLLF